MISSAKTPLRYPGGKGRLAALAAKLIEYNELCDGQYVEPYAGGAGIAASLLLSEHVRGIVLNDVSYPINCFWRAVVEAPDYLCRRIRDVKVTPRTWRRQKAVLTDASNRSFEEVGFALLFLNRTNRSGIISGGMIGGRSQKGAWRIDARFYREELIRRIAAIAEYRHRISLFCMDAKDFLRRVVSRIEGKCCVYFDPPYYVAGRRLYLDTYGHEDHKRIASVIQTETIHPWFATYDDHDVIRSLYAQRRQRLFDLRYSASVARIGREVMIFSDRMRLPRGLFAGEFGGRIT